MRKRKSERGEKNFKKLRKERLHTFLHPAMEQCEQSPSYSGCFKLENRSSNIHHTEGLMNWRGASKNGEEKINFAPARNWMPATACDLTDSWKSWLFLCTVIL